MRRRSKSSSRYHTAAMLDGYRNDFLKSLPEEEIEVFTSDDGDASDIKLVYPLSTVILRRLGDKGVQFYRTN